VALQYSLGIYQYAGGLRLSLIGERAASWLASMAACAVSGILKKYNVAAA
jgi:hypothetical protein